MQSEEHSPAPPRPCHLDEFVAAIGPANLQPPPSCRSFWGEVERNGRRDRMAWPSYSCWADARGCSLLISGRVMLYGAKLPLI